MTHFIKNNIYGLENDGIRDFRWTFSNFNAEFLNQTEKYVKMNIGSPGDRLLKLTYEDGSEQIININIGWHDYIIEHKNNTIKFSIDNIQCESDRRDLGLMISSMTYVNSELIKQKILLVGSAWYIKEWWHQNVDSFKFDKVCCINNAFLVTHDKTDTWYIANDFLHSNNFNLEKFKTDALFNCSKKFGITSKFLNAPYWYNPHPTQCGTMLLNAIFDILNTCNLKNINCELYLIGCDLNYSKPISHFYGNGQPDPLRLGKEYLCEELTKIKHLYERTGNEIINLSNEEGLLPFKKYNI